MALPVKTVFDVPIEQFKSFNRLMAIRSNCLQSIDQSTVQHTSGSKEPPDCRVYTKESRRSNAVRHIKKLMNRFKVSKFPFKLERELRH